LIAIACEWHHCSPLSLADAHSHSL
jgi:hypothetical protein